MRAGYCLCIVMSVCMLSVALAAEKQKHWSMQDEVYCIWWAGLDLEEMKSAGVTLVSHVPVTKEYFAEAHAHGLRVAPYVSLYKTVNLSEWPELKVHPFFRELDLVKHPGWALIASDGKLAKPFDVPTYPAYQSCCNAPGIDEAYVRGIKALMDMGADGVFVDNVHPTLKCSGVDLGIAGHTHVHADKNNEQMFRIALKKVYDCVKSYGADKVVMLNPGQYYTECGDSWMPEAYICSFPENHRWEWERIIRLARRWADSDYVRSGNGITALAYFTFDTRWWAVDNAYYSYACARLGQFLWTGALTGAGPDLGDITDKPDEYRGPGGNGLSPNLRHNDVLRLLFRVRLGKPTGPIAEVGGVTYRPYERGLVAVNPSYVPRSVELPTPAACKEPSDLYSGAVLPVREKAFTAAVPAESGRVFVDRGDLAASYLEEVRLSASQIVRRIRALKAENQPEAAESLAVLGRIGKEIELAQSQAGACCH